MKLDVLDGDYRIDPTVEPLVAMPQLPALAEKQTGHRPHMNACRRWVTRGVRGERLPSILWAGRRYVTKGALEYWLARINAAANPSEPVAPAGAVTATQRAALERAGIKVPQ